MLLDKIFYPDYSELHHGAKTASAIPIMAKVGLVYEDKSLAIEKTRAPDAGGVSWLTVRGRTKLEAYRPPAHWH